MSTWHIYGCIVVSALIPIHLGAVASVKAPKSVRKQRKDAPDDDEEMERITWSDALLFPLLAAVLLTILFFAFKYFDAAILNKILNAYLSLVGSAGVVRFALYLHPPSNAPKYTLCLSKADKSIFNCKFQLRHLLCISASATFMAAHVWTGHWTLQNAFGLILAFNAISLLCLDSFRAGAVLLAGLFVYDIVMVFYTPMMVSVATSFDAPIKIVWPRDDEQARRAFAMLGLGDIVLPGVFIALARRFDYHLALKRSGKPLLPSDGYATPYYRWQIASYLLALATTMVAMHWSNHPQPALLYIAPACLAGVALCAAWRGEWQEMCSWTEQDEDTAKDGKQAKVDDKDA